MADPERFPVLQVLHKIRRSTLSKEERSVLHACALRANAKGEVLATVEDLAADTAWSVRSVKRARAELVRRGLLLRPTRYGRVRIRVEALEAVQREDFRTPEEAPESEVDEPLTEHGRGQGGTSRGQGGPSHEEAPDHGRGHTGTSRGQGGTSRGQGGPPSTTSTLSVPSEGSTPLPPDGGQVLAFPERAKHESDPVRTVLEAWWDLWGIRAPKVEGYKRKRTGKAQGAPSSPEFTSDDRAAVAKVLKGRKARTVEELVLLARWAFNAPGFHARLMRGEAKPDQLLNEYLNPVALYRPQKLAEKLAKARVWHDAEEPQDQGVQLRTGAGGGDYVPLDELWGSPQPPPIDIPFEPAD